MCIERLGSGSSVPQCTRIITDLATALPSDVSAGVSECQEVLDTLEERHGVLSSAIDDLERCVPPLPRVPCAAEVARPRVTSSDSHGG